MLRDFCAILFLTAICLRHVIYLMEDLAKLYQQGTSQILTLWITWGLLIKIPTIRVDLFTIFLRRSEMVDFSWTAIGFGGFTAVVLGFCTLMYLNADNLERLAKQLFKR